MIREAFSFQGRARRRVWWFQNLAMFVAWLFVTTTIVAIFFPGLPFGEAVRRSGPVPFTTLTGLLLLWPNAAITLRRAHDRDRSGLIPFLVFVVSWLASELFHSPSLRINGPIYELVGLINLGAAFYLTVVMGFLPGTPGPNRFGPSPKAAKTKDSTATVFD